MIYDKPFWDVDFLGLHPIWLSQEPKEAFGSNLDSSKWYQGITSFKTVHSHENALCAYISSYEVFESLSDQEVMSVCTRLIRQFMGRNDIPEPKSILRFI